MLSKLKGKIKGHCIIGPCLRVAVRTPIRMLSLNGIASVKEWRMGHIPWMFSPRFLQLLHQKKQSQLEKLKVTFGGKGQASVSRDWKMVYAEHTPSVSIQGSSGKRGVVLWAHNKWCKCLIEMGNKALNASWHADLRPGRTRTPISITEWTANKQSQDKRLVE